MPQKGGRIEEGKGDGGMVWEEEYFMVSMVCRERERDNMLELIQKGGKSLEGMKVLPGGELLSTVVQGGERLSTVVQGGVRLYQAKEAIQQGQQEQQEAAEKKKKIRRRRPTEDECSGCYAACLERCGEAHNNSQLTEALAAVNHAGGQDNNHGHVYKRGVE